VERSCGPMNKKRIEGIADQGERAKDREALVTKRKRRRSGGRAVKECVFTLEDLTLCLKGCLSLERTRTFLYRFKKQLHIRLHTRVPNCLTAPE